MPRPSHVRDAVRRLIHAGDRHDWSVDELAISSGGDFSSVFRALARLEREGAVRRVELGDGRARYEVAGDHHDHFRCESCGQVTALPGCAIPKPSLPEGYRATGHTVVVSGRCPRCR